MTGENEKKTDSAQNMQFHVYINTHTHTNICLLGKIIQWWIFVVVHILNQRQRSHPLGYISFWIFPERVTLQFLPVIAGNPVIETVRSSVNDYFPWLHSPAFTKPIFFPSNIGSVLLHVNHNCLRRSMSVLTIRWNESKIYFLPQFLLYI